MTDDPYHLVFVGKEFDRHEYHEYETGFSQAGRGDSGNPYWMKINRAVDSEETVNSIVAVHSANLGGTGSPRGTYLYGQEFQCRSRATKVTDNISKWVMDIHNWAEELDST